MKLIDLLVQELPELGGWPKDADEAYWHAGHRLLNFYFDGGHLSNHAPIEWREKISLIGAEFEPDESDNTGQTVTREQYETALAASQQPEWDGAGLPPVGVECECKVTVNWFRCKVMYISEKCAVLKYGESEQAWFTSSCEFRPIRTEAERKRELFLNEMFEFARQKQLDSMSDLMEQLYDAIENGEIKSLKFSG